MNDPVIHAPISKIVEAIMPTINNILHNAYVDGIITRNTIEQALASLGGEEVNNDEIVKSDTPFSKKFPKHKDGDLYLIFWFDDTPPDIAYLHKDTGLKGVLMRIKGTDTIVNVDVRILRRKIEFMAFPAVNWSRVCECDWDSRIGETWCCNHCGLPTSNHTRPSEREVLSGEQFYEKFREVRNELSAVTGTYSLSEAIIKTYDRYLAEKQSKTEKK